MPWLFSESSLTEVIGISSLGVEMKAISDDSHSDDGGHGECVIDDKEEDDKMTMATMLQSGRRRQEQ